MPNSVHWQINFLKVVNSFLKTMKRIFKLWWSTIPPIPTQANNYISHQITNTSQQLYITSNNQHKPTIIYHIKSFLIFNLTGRFESNFFFYFQKHDLMAHVAHQLIVLNFILELGKSMDINPRGCVAPFFSRLFYL